MRRTALSLLLLAAPAFATPPRPDFKALVGAVKASPSDDELRVALLKTAAKLKTAPSVPTEARRHFVKAVTLQKDAKDPSELEGAIAEYRLALAEAPWWADAYFNLAVAQEGAAKFADAKKNLELYLLTAPKDTAAAQDRLFALEAKAEKAAGAAARYAWLLGSWTVQITWIANGRAQEPFPSFAAAGKKLDASVVINSPALDILRATPEGDGWRWSYWQEPLPSRPANCAVPTGWQDVSVDVSADKRTLIFRVPTYWTHACELGAIDANVYRLTR